MTHAYMLADEEIAVQSNGPALALERDCRHVRELLLQKPLDGTTNAGAQHAVFVAATLAANFCDAAAASLLWRRSAFAAAASHRRRRWLHENDGVAALRLVR